jgi:hypothetical protein
LVRGCTKEVENVEEEIVVDIEVWVDRQLGMKVVEHMG